MLLDVNLPYLPKWLESFLMKTSAQNRGKVENDSLPQTDPEHNLWTPCPVTDSLETRLITLLSWQPRATESWGGQGLEGWSGSSLQHKSWIKVSLLDPWSVCSSLFSWKSSLFMLLLPRKIFILIVPKASPVSVTVCSLSCN